MSDRYYSVDVKFGSSQIPVPAQTGIRDQRTANALKLLYPKRMSPSVGEDTVSISALGRSYAQAARAGAPDKIEEASVPGETAQKASKADQPDEAPKPAPAASATGASTSTWVA